MRRPAGFRARAPALIRSEPGIFWSAGVSVTPARTALIVMLARRQLHRELAHVGLERRLRARDRPVVRQDAGAAAARHGEDPAAGAHQPPGDDVLRPVDEAVRHDVERHVHLILGHGLLGIVGDEGPERAEGEGVEEHPEPALLAARLELALERVQHLGPPGGVRRVDVEEARLAAAPLAPRPRSARRWARSPCGRGGRRPPTSPLRRARARWPRRTRTRRRGSAPSRTDGSGNPRDHGSSVRLRAAREWTSPRGLF